MAKPLPILKRHHSEQIRGKIQSSQLITRLTKHAMGEIELGPTQVRAIEILLKKTVPDLSQVEGTNVDGSHQLNITIRRFSE